MRQITNRIIRTSPYDYYTLIKHSINKIATRKIITGYIRDSKSPKLQIGCGENLVENWLNTDLFPSSDKVAFLNAGKKFPFDDNTFNFVYSEHIFEHLTFKESCNFLSESFRILKPNGVIRIAVPHCDFLFRIYQNPELPVHKAYAIWATELFCKDVAKLFPDRDYSEIYAINNFYRDWGHQVLHSFESLNALLLKFNFIEFKKMEIVLSNHEELSNMENHSNIIPDEFNRLETLVVEAQKIN